MTTLRTGILLVVLLLLSTTVTFAGPPEPPGFTADQESMTMFIRQYESIRQVITTMAESQDKRDLQLLLDSVGMKLFYARTATELAKAWTM